MIEHDWLIVEARLEYNCFWNYSTFIRSGNCECCVFASGIAQIFRAKMSPTLPLQVQNCLYANNYLCRARKLCWASPSVTWLWFEWSWCKSWTVIVLCSWTRHVTVTVPLSTWMSKWVAVNLIQGCEGDVLWEKLHVPYFSPLILLISFWQKSKKNIVEITVTLVTLISTMFFSFSL